MKSGIRSMAIPEFGNVAPPTRVFFGENEPRGRACRRRGPAGGGRSVQRGPCRQAGRPADAQRAGPRPGPFGKNRRSGLCFPESRRESAGSGGSQDKPGVRSSKTWGDRRGGGTVQPGASDRPQIRTGQDEPSGSTQAQEPEIAERTELLTPISTDAERPRDFPMSRRTIPRRGGLLSGMQKKKRRFPALLPFW